jgi:hypothetical protein
MTIRRLMVNEELSTDANENYTEGFISTLVWQMGVSVTDLTKFVGNHWNISERRMR